MKKGRTLLIISVLFIIVGSISADASALRETVANQPWTIETIDDDEPGVMNLSTAFGGKFQIPMFSYYRTDTNALALVHKATNAAPGNIGPDSSWLRVGIPITTHNPIGSAISNLATFLYGPDTFGVKWVYGTTGGQLRGMTYEFQNDMTYVGHSTEVLVDLGKFGETLIGAPSLQADGRWFRIAFTILDSNNDIKLIYVQKTGELNNSCLISGTSYYQCDVIDMSIMWIGQPSLQITPGGKVGIAYEKFGIIKYAYPHDHTMLFPSNCGPGDPKTWRCTTIYDGAHVGSNVQLAFGQTEGRAIVFRKNDTLVVAQYVGSGGNCGEDGLIGNLKKQWNCKFLQDFINNPEPSYSIAVDPRGYPVVAYDNAPSAIGPRNLYLAFQPGYVGSEPADYWNSMFIDHAPRLDVNNGEQAAIAFNKAGFGLIAYRQDDGYYDTDPLKIAWQQPIFTTYLPIIID